MIHSISGLGNIPSDFPTKATPEEVKLVQDALNPKDKVYLNGVQAYQQHKSYTEVLDYGTVSSVMPPDNEGNKHQLFMLKLDSGVMVRVAHNTSIADDFDLAAFVINIHVVSHLL